MSQLTRQQVEELLQNKPKGISDRAIIDSLIKQGHQLEGLELPSQQKVPNTIERVSSTIGQAGEDVYNQIAGEGQYAGQSAVQRGTGAVASAFQAIPDTTVQAIPEPLGGGLIRAGYEKLGNVIGGAFNKAANALAETDIIKGAAGQEVVGTGGEVDYVPNDLGFLEEALGTTANIGETAGVAAGAGVAPRAITRTTNAIADVGREALDRTINATSNLAQKATPKSVRTILRLNPPETRAKATNELTDAYMSGLVEGRKATNNKLDTLAAAETFGNNVVTRDSLIRELAAEGYVPRIEGQFAKFDDVFKDIDARQKDIAEKIDNELAPYSNRVEAQTSLDRLRDEAEAILRQSPQGTSGILNSINELNRMFQNFAESYGNTLTPVDVNDIRKEMNRVTSAYKAKSGEKIYELDTADAVGKATRSRLDEVAPEVRNLNQEWAKLNRVDNTARILNNEIVEVGLIGRKLGSYVGTVGLSLAGLNLAGPGGLVIAGIAAQLGGDALATLLRNRKFDPKLREAIIKNVTEDPATAERLIREASPENKAFLRNLLIGGGAIGGAEYFLDEGDSALVVGSIGNARKLNSRGKKVVDDFLSHVDGTKKLTGDELKRVRNEAQQIGEAIGANVTGTDKKLADDLADMLTGQRRN